MSGKTPRFELSSLVSLKVCQVKHQKAILRVFLNWYIEKLYEIFHGVRTLFDNPITFFKFLIRYSLVKVHAIEIV